MDSDELRRRLEYFDGSIIEITNYNLHKKRQYASEKHRIKLEFDPQCDVDLDEAEEKRLAKLEKSREYHRKRAAYTNELRRNRDAERKGTSKTDSTQ